MTTSTTTLTAEQVQARIDEHFDGDAWQGRLATIVLGLDHDADPDEHWTQRNGTVQAIVRHVAPSGMTRWIDLYAVVDGDLMLVRPEWYTLHNLSRTRHEGYRVPGCGMDMTFHLLSTMFEQAKRVLGIAYDEWPYQEHLPRIHQL